MDAFDETGFSSATYKVLHQIDEGATTDETLAEFGGKLHLLPGELITTKNLCLCLPNEQPGRLNFPYYVDERDSDSMQELDVPLHIGSQIGGVLTVQTTMPTLQTNCTICSSRSTGPTMSGPSPVQGWARRTMPSSELSTPSLQQTVERLLARESHLLNLLSLARDAVVTMDA